MGAKRRGVLELYRLGRVGYAQSLALQQKFRERLRSGVCGHTLLCLEHPPTFTVGMRNTVANVLSPPEELARIGAELHHTSRGGDVTYHGPGQSILYPIVSLRQLPRLGSGARAYAEGLEDTMVAVSKSYGLDASGRIPLQQGCWVQGQRKIGAVGLRIQNGVTSHGLAFNVNPDLSFYQHIVPCGIADKEVTSLAKETGCSDLDQQLVTQQLTEAFVETLGFTEVVEKCLDDETMQALNSQAALSSSS